MPDERQDSIAQGIGAPAESPSGVAADEERRQLAAEGPPIGGGMGGTPVDRPGDEAQFNAEFHDEIEESRAAANEDTRSGDARRP